MPDRVTAGPSREAIEAAEAAFEEAGAYMDSYREASQAEADLLRAYPDEEPQLHKLAVPTPQVQAAVEAAFPVIRRDVAREVAARLRRSQNPLDHDTADFIEREFGGDRG